MSELLKLRDELRKFAAERDWDQFHSPKNLVMALAVEAAELMEPFQWLTEAESAALAPEKRAQVEEEMADVLLYLVRLADKLDVDLVAAAERKLKANAVKYPVEKARGRRAKRRSTRSCDSGELVPERRSGEAPPRKSSSEVVVSLRQRHSWSTAENALSDRLRH